MWRFWRIVVKSLNDQFAIFARFAKFAGFTRGPSSLLICIGLQVVSDFDQFAIFARFAKFAGFPRGPSCLLICIGLQVVVGEILPFLLLCAFLDISRGARIRQKCGSIVLLVWPTRNKLIVILRRWKCAGVDSY